MQVSSVLLCHGRCCFAGSTGKHPDPCKEICDIPVKIADLGNACWTVSMICVSWSIFVPSSLTEEF